VGGEMGKKNQGAGACVQPSMRGETLVMYGNDLSMCGKNYVQTDARVRMRPSRRCRHRSKPGPLAQPPLFLPLGRAGLSPEHPGHPDPPTMKPLPLHSLRVGPPPPQGYPLQVHPAAATAERRERARPQESLRRARQDGALQRERDSWGWGWGW